MSKLTVTRQRLSERTPRFSAVAFVVAAVAVGTGATLGLVLVPTVGSYLGMLAGGFVAGLALERRPLVEAGVAAALASVGILFAAVLPGSSLAGAASGLTSIPLTTLLASVALAFVVGSFGAHFGDDLREGLTTPVETGPSRPGERAGTPPAVTDFDTDPERSEPDAATAGESADSDERTDESENVELEKS